MSDDGQEPTQPTENITPPTAPQTELPPETPKTFDAAYVKKLRVESAKNRKDLQAAQAELQKLQTAQEAAETAELEAQGQWKELAEQNAAKTTQLEAQLAEQESRLNIERRNTLAVTIATQLGAIDPTDANFASVVSAIDIAADDAQGKVKQALEALKEVRPYLFGTGKPNLAPFNPGGKPSSEPIETDAQRRQRIQGGSRSKFFSVTVYSPVDDTKTGGT